MTRYLSLVAALMLAAPASAHQTSLGDLDIVHANVPMPHAGAKSAAGYMVIVNHGTAADRLIGVTAGFAAESSVHESKTDADGVATMAAVPALDIPPGDSVVLEPGGYHIMFMGLTATLNEGEMLPATLMFQNAGAVAVEFMVDPPGAAGGAEHNH